MVRHQTFDALHVCHKDVESMPTSIRQWANSRDFLYLWHIRAEKAQTSLRKRAVSPEPPLLAYTEMGHGRMLKPTTSNLYCFGGQFFRFFLAYKICFNDVKIRTKTSLSKRYLNRVVQRIVFSWSTVFFFKFYI